MWNLEEAGADRHKLHTKGPTQSDTRIALGGPGWTLELCLLGACPRLFLGPFPPSASSQLCYGMRVLPFY